MWPILLILALMAIPPAAAAEDTPLAARLAAEEDRYQRLMADDKPAEALEAARLVVESTRELHGADSVELASPLTNLATAEMRSGQLPAAEGNYETAIALLERHAGILTPRLANPLIGLGETRLRAGQYALAAETFARALRVHQVNNGFFNAGQGVIRDGLTESYLGQQDLEKANFQQRAQYAWQERRLGATNPELLPALEKLGLWYERSNQPEDARLIYMAAARLVSKGAGADPRALVEQYIAMARTYRQQALLPPGTNENDGREGLLPLASAQLRRGLELVDALQPPDPPLKARLLVELGDVALLGGRRTTAVERYAEAWSLLAGSPDNEAELERYFASPRLIWGPSLPAVWPVPSRKAPPADPQRLEPAFVTVRYTVDAAGRALVAEVIEADPQGLIERRVLDAVRGSLYRPRLVDGAPVTTAEQFLRHEFRYQPGKLPKVEPEAPAGSDQPLPTPD
jgi:tetratricopeptide (TPR) repeat protein